MRVSELDPFGLDPFYQTHLGGYPPDTIHSTLVHALRVANNWPEPDLPTAMAMLRDLDPLMRALETHAPNSWRLPGIEARLQRLGFAADHTPCGANDTYGRFNPLAPRTRNFTGTAEEHALYNGLAIGESKLDELLFLLNICMRRPIDDPVHAWATGGLVQKWEPMVWAARLMRKVHVAPVMGEQIAPWVSHIFTIGGRAYRGPTAAQLPVVLVDRWLWGADSPDTTYQEYASYYANEQPTPRRARIADALQLTDGRSLLTRYKQELATTRNRAVAKRSVEGLLALAVRMYGFRTAHLQFARESLVPRPHWGTGAFDPDMLLRLRDHTETMRDELQAML